MRFLRKVEGSKNLFNYPVVEDIAFAAHFSSILQHLQPPKTNNSYQLEFANVKSIDKIC